MSIQVRTFDGSYGKYLPTQHQVNGRHASVLKVGVCILGYMLLKRRQLQLTLKLLANTMVLGYDK